MKTRHTINQACAEVAASLRSSDINDAPMIRTALNDHLDAIGKDGFTVNFNFDQDRAVKRIRKLLACKAV